MSDLATLDGHAALTAPDTLTIQRLLPGPIERVWAYLTESDKRRQWLASGDMPAEIGGSFELVWRNDELTNPPGQRPEGYGAEHRGQCRITEFDPPRKLAYIWEPHGEVSFALAPSGNKVLLTMIHSRLPDGPTRLSIFAGWHSHTDLLVARLSGVEPAPHWDNFRRLRAEYEQRVSV